MGRPGTQKLSRIAALKAPAVDVTPAACYAAINYPHPAIARIFKPSGRANLSIDRGPLVIVQRVVSRSRHETLSGNDSGIRNALELDIPILLARIA